MRDMPASRDPDATADATVGDDTQKHNYVVAGAHPLVMLGHLMGVLGQVFVSQMRRRLQWLD